MEREEKERKRKGLNLEEKKKGKRMKERVCVCGLEFREREIVYCFGSSLNISTQKLFSSRLCKDTFCQDFFQVDFNILSPNLQVKLEVGIEPLDSLTNARCILSHV